MGLVASLNRPGGNITGATGLNVEIGAKRLQVLQELVPAAKKIAVLVNPTNPVTCSRNWQGQGQGQGDYSLRQLFANAAIAHRAPSRRVGIAVRLRGRQQL
jgi:hypothetical protein